MSDPDLEAARRHHAALKRIIDGHAGGADLRAMRRALDLCRRASETVDDAYCAEKMRLAAEYAAELLAHDEHRKWERSALPGAEFLKQQILNALELSQSRLYSIEAMRRAARRGASGHEPLLPRQR